ncbi:hypothetical protein HHJ79_10430 [Mobiluncus mulieris]|nr:hypothetical protein [Mobiluncus mulieris]
MRQALNMAYACRGRKPAGLVLHAGRGCQFMSRELGEYAKESRVDSLDGTHRGVGITRWLNRFGQH